MMSTASFRIVIVGAAALIVGGCAHAVPAELTSARMAHQRSSAGPAARLVPAELHQAEMALAKAEASFADDPKSFHSRDLAYVAHRKFQKADALASISADQGQHASSRGTTSPRCRARSSTSRRPT